MVEEAKFNVYQIVYEDWLERKSYAIVSAGSDGEASGMLEKYLNEIDKKNNEEGKRGSIHPKVKSIGIKCSEKKIISVFDVWTDSEL